MSCKYREECPSRTGWCEGPKQDFEKCIPFLIASQKRWNQEAVTQAMAAGGFRHELEVLRDDLDKSMRDVVNQMKTEADQDILLQLHVKYSVLRRQHEKVTEILNRKPKKETTSENLPEWQQAVIRHFTRVE